MSRTPSPSTNNAQIDGSAYLADRRAVLRMLRGSGLTIGALGAFGVNGLVAALAGCSTTGSSGGNAAPAGTIAGGGTTVGSIRRSAYDPNRPYWLQGGFAPTKDTLDVSALEVTGSIPSGLSGLFIRNGSNPALGESGHWFLGDGMVHGVRFEAGRALWYRNRYVETPMVHKSSGLAGGGPPGKGSNQSNVSAFAHAGKLFTSGEVGFPYEIDPTDLSTVGVYDFGGALQTSMTAHPKIDPVTGKMHFFGYGFTPPYLTYHVVDVEGRLERSEVIPVAGPTMIHDFAITDREAVFWEGPVIFDLQEAIKMVQGQSGTFPFRWQPEYGSRIGILPFGEPGASTRWVEIDPCYVFHGVNAFRDDEKVVVDVCRLPSAFSATGDLTTTNAIHRWTVDTSGEKLTFADERRSDEQLDLPGIDRRFVGHEHRHAWFAMTDKETSDFPFDLGGIHRMDYQTGASDVWDPKGRERAGEGVFVAGGDGEGEGWILTFSHDQTSDKSDLVIFDALGMQAGPIARVHIPARVPYGFHGWWLPLPAG